MIVIIDYGMGNLRSVSKALESLGAATRVSSDPSEVAKADKLILPGVGAFGAAMEELTRRGLIEPIKAAIAAGTPYLGICLGLQLLFDSSEESPGVAGLSIFKGTVKRFAFPSHLTPHTSHLKVPHMGWNQVMTGQWASAEGLRCPLVKETRANSFFYFVHSYYADPAERSLIALEADHGGRFAAMVWRDHLFATQFHPEKSQAVGLKLLENFVNL
ncbi:MAG: imidazole glycerol phosphate synthase subunit HisH [Candidatus Omnitrophica bacterium]|nr:imidazole glycerol phosphate synthase subunit HisH [Candidatus Omnitrophota bacterium]